jgi:hypothetical protein
MRRNTPFLLVAFLVSLLSQASWSHAQSAPEPPQDSRPEIPEQPTEQDASAEFGLTDGLAATSQTTSILRVVCRPESGLANPGLIESLLNSKRVMQQTLRDILKDAEPLPEAAWPAVMLNPGPFNGQDSPLPSGALPEGVYMAELSVSSFDKRVTAAQVLAGLRTALGNELVKLDREGDQDEATLRQVEVTYQEQQQMLLHLQGQINNDAAVAGLAHEDQYLETRLLRIDAERQSATVLLAELTASRTVIEARIAAVGQEALEAAEADELIGQLEKVVALRKARLAAMIAAQMGPASQAEEDIATAEAEVLKHRRAAAQARGGERLGALLRRLDETTINFAQTEARLKVLEEDQQEVLAVIGRSTKVNLLKREYEVLQSSVQKMATQLQELRLMRRLRAVPVVILVGTTPAAGAEQ